MLAQIPIYNILLLNSVRANQCRSSKPIYLITSKFICDVSYLSQEIYADTALKVFHNTC